jgi:hypothetical protein
LLKFFWVRFYEFSKIDLQGWLSSVAPKNRFIVVVFFD